VTGIIISETDDAITLKSPGGIVAEYEKSEVVAREKMSTSFMPVGLQATLSTQDLVDLVEFLTTLEK